MYDKRKVLKHKKNMGFRYTNPPSSGCVSMSNVFLIIVRRKKRSVTNHATNKSPIISDAVIVARRTIMAQV